MRNLIGAFLLWAGAKIMRPEFRETVGRGFAEKILSAVHIGEIATPDPEALRRVGAFDRRKGGRA